MVIYADLLGDINDAAWLAACRAAATTCRFFPVPAELVALAEECADGATRDQLTVIDRQRIDQAITDTNRLLASGLTGEKAEENKAWYEARFAETIAIIRANGEKAADRSEFWGSGRRRNARRQMMPPVFRHPHPGPNDA
jgi:hypothetical protein